MYFWKNFSGYYDNIESEMRKDCILAEYFFIRDGKERKMLHIFNRTKLISVTDPEKKAKIQQVLSQNDIEYAIKMPDIYRKNTFDQAAVGSFGVNQNRMVYSFYVNRKNAEAALALIRGEMR